MAKRKPAKTRPMTDLEMQLTKIVDHIAPGNVTLNKSRLGYELSVDRRDAKMGWVTKSIGDVVASAAEDIESPDDEKIIPAWRRLTRMQREVVTRTLRELESRHMAAAAVAKIARSPSAFAEYELADAFRAAGEELDFLELDEDGGLVTNERLDAEPSCGRDGKD